MRTTPALRFPALALVALALLGSPRGLLAAPKSDPKAEAKAKEKIAATALQGVQELVDLKAPAEAARALAEARAADAEKGAADALEAKVKALGKAETSAEGKARWAKLAGDVAKEWEKLGGLAHAPADDARFEGYVFRAAELEPSKARLGKLFAAAKQAAGNKARAEVAGRMLARLRDLDADAGSAAKYDALEQEMAADDVALIKGRHPMVGWLSLPSGWTKKGPWSVLVAVEGAGSNFVGSARNFLGGRGPRKFLVLAPVSLSNTNELDPAKYGVYDPALLKEWNAKRVEFDVAGLESLLEVLRARYGADEKIAITGFSGGGNLCYSMVLQRPERVWAAAPACANYQPGLANGAKKVEGGGPPVHVLTGANDEHKDHVFGQKPGIEGQSDWAMESFQKLGFTRVKRTMLPGVGHSACVREVWTFLDEVLAAK
jgi:poly(3-hydroxybutyrate) depolymerase